VKEPANKLAFLVLMAEGPSVFQSRPGVGFATDPLGPAKNETTTARQNAQVLFAFCRMSLVYHGCRCLMGGEPRLRVEPGDLVAVAGMTAIGASSSLQDAPAKVGPPPGEAIRSPSRSSTALDPEPTAQTDRKAEVREGAADRAMGEPTGGYPRTRPV
jgi:hypothetical protein